MNLLKNKPLIVAEIGWNFLGNLKLAKKMILSAKKNGADAVKFQLWNPKNLKKGAWDHDGRRDIYNKSFLDLNKFRDLYKYSKKIKIICFASIFSKEDLKIHSKINKDIVKIPSSEAYDIPLIKLAIKNFKNVIISTGDLKKKELKKLMDLKSKKIILLHCVSSYPLDDINVNFNKFLHLKKNFKRVGYSGHSKDTNDAFWAISNDACIIEKHFTINQKLSGRDNKFSILPKELKKIVDFRDFHFKANSKSSLELQNCEKDIFNNYRGRWRLNE